MIQELGQSGERTGRQIFFTRAVLSLLVVLEFARSFSRQYRLSQVVGEMVGAAQ